MKIRTVVSRTSHRCHMPPNWLTTEKTGPNGKLFSVIVGHGDTDICVDDNLIQW